MLHDIHVHVHVQYVNKKSSYTIVINSVVLLSHYSSTTVVLTVIDVLDTTV